jgi:hypothetical protein
MKPMPAMKLCTVIVCFLLITSALGGGASACAEGVKQLSVREIAGAPAGCLPENEGKSIKLERVLVGDDYAENAESQYLWAIELIPGAKPLTLRPGECVAFGKPIEGYRQVRELRPLEEGKTYGFAFHELDDQIKDFVDKTYLGYFCVQRATNGRLTYLPYVEHQDGTITYPTCGRYIGGAPAKDGIVPKDVP